MSTKTICNFLFFVFVGSTAFLHCTPPNNVIATIGVGITPGGLAVTPDGQFVYVANNNNDAIAGSNTVSVIDVATNTPLTLITDASFNAPYTVTINPAGTKAYVTNSGSTTITIINIADNTILGTITGFFLPSGLVITPDGTIGYVNNYGDAGLNSGKGTTVRVVNMNTGMITGPAITVGLAPAALAISPDGAFVYCVNYVDGTPGTGTMSVIRTSDNTVIATIPGFFGPFGISVTPDGKYAYVTNFGSNNFNEDGQTGSTVSVVDLTSYTIVDTITLGTQPSGVAVTPDGKYLYLSNYDTLYLGPDFTDLTAFKGIVNIVNTANNQVILPGIEVGFSPDFIVITPDGRYAYVSNYGSNTVTVIAIPTFAVTAQGCKKYNVFLTQKELVNKLTWSASGVSLPVYYSIYRDPNLTDLVATLQATEPLVFFDHNRIPGVTYTYYVVGVNSDDVASYPAAITVTQKC